MLEPREVGTEVEINEISYCIEKMIGRGGSSFVYKAFTGENRKRFFIIKEFAPLDLDKYLERSEQGIVPIKGYGFFKELLNSRKARFKAEVDNYPFFENNNPAYVFLPLWGNYSEDLFVCATSEGESLNDWKEHQKKANENTPYTYIKACMNIAKKIIESLEQLHQTQIHFDIKTENIYLAGHNLSSENIVDGYSNFQVKFLDFGSACNISNFANQETLTQTLKNLSITEEFAAPILLDIMPCRSDSTTRIERAAYINPNVDYFSVIKVLQDLLVPKWRDDPNCTEIIDLGTSDKAKNVNNSIQNLFSYCANFDPYPPKSSIQEACEDSALEIQKKKPYEEFRYNYDKDKDYVKNEILRRIKQVILTIDNPAGFYSQYALGQAKRILQSECGDTVEETNENIDERLLAPVICNAANKKDRQYLYEYYDRTKENTHNVQAIVLSANGGAGKTTALLHLFKKLLKNALSDDTAIIPFFIPLRKIDDNDINQFICREYFGSQSNSESLIEWIKETERRIIFILDGFEDYRGNDENLKAWWDRIKDLSTARRDIRDIIISVRTMEAHRKANNEINKSFPLSAFEDEFDILQMQGMDMEQLKRYFVGVDGMSLLSKGKPVSELLYLPMMARLAREVLINPNNTYSVYWNQKKNLEVNDISQARLMKAYVDIQIYKYSQGNVERWKKAIFFNISRRAASKGHWEFDTLKQDDEFNIACQCGIMRVIDNKHIFAHRQWHEFLIAYWLSEQIDNYIDNSGDKKGIDARLYELSFSESVYRMAGELLGIHKTNNALAELRKQKAAIDFSNLVKREDVTAGTILRYLAKLNRPEMTMREIGKLSEEKRVTDQIANLTSNVINIMKQQYRRNFANLDLSGLDLTATSLQKVEEVSMDRCQDSIFSIETFGIPICSQIKQISTWKKYIISIIEYDGRRAFVVIDKEKEEITTCHIGELFYFDEIRVHKEYEMFARIAGYRKLGEEQYQVTILNLNERGEVFIVPSSKNGQAKAVNEEFENNSKDVSIAKQVINRKKTELEKCQFCPRKKVGKCSCKKRLAD